MLGGREGAGRVWRYKVIINDNRQCRVEKSLIKWWQCWVDAVTIN